MLFKSQECIEGTLRVVQWLRIRLAKRSDLVHWEDPEGAGGEGGGRGVWDGEHM